MHMRMLFNCMYMCLLNQVHAGCMYLILKSLSCEYACWCVRVLGMGDIENFVCNNYEARIS